MKTYATFLREKVAVIGTPVSRQALLDQLNAEMIS
jgi:hypothetical protein